MAELQRGPCPVLQRLWGRGRPGAWSRSLNRSGEEAQLEEEGAAVPGRMVKGQTTGDSLGGPTGHQVRSNGDVLKSRQESENRNFDKISKTNSIKTQGSESGNGFLCTEDAIQILTKACEVLQDLALAFPFSPISLYIPHCLYIPANSPVSGSSNILSFFSDSEPFYMLFPLPGILSSCSPPPATSHPLAPDLSSPSSLSSNVTFRDIFLDLLIYPSITPAQLHSVTVFLNPLPVSHVI